MLAPLIVATNTLRGNPLVCDTSLRCTFQNETLCEEEALFEEAER